VPLCCRFFEIDAFMLCRGLNRSPEEYPLPCQWLLAAHIVGFGRSEEVRGFRDLAAMSPQPPPDLDSQPSGFDEAYDGFWVFPDANTCQAIMRLSPI
jgi:hypothetical protein